MKKCIVFGMLFGLAGVVFAADSSPKDDVLAAAKKLAEKGDYSWKMTLDFGPNSNFQPGPTEGKTDKAGTVWLSSTFGDMTTVGIKRGDKIAVKSDQGWEAGAAPDAGGGGGPDPVLGMTRRLRNAQLPAAQLEDLVAKSKEIRKEGDAYAGELTEEGAKALLTAGWFGRRGGAQPEARDSKGSVKIWIKDGQVSKYEFKVQGIVKGRNGEDRDVDRTTTVEIKDIGATKIEVPDEAAKKLS